MKKLYILLLFMMCAGYAQQQPFITTWEVTSNFGTGLVIQIPIIENEGNLVIDFGNGPITYYEDVGIIEHYFLEPGIYTVAIYGPINRINFNAISSTFASKLKTIEQWGDSPWNNMSGSFANCSNLTINAIDSPNLEQVTNMSYMFYNCYSLNGNFNSWDLSNVNNMYEMFANCSAFNSPLSN